MNPTRVSRLLECCLHPLLGEELGMQNQARLRALTGHLQVAPDLNVQLGFELHHDPENRVDLSLMAVPGTLHLLGDVQVPEWWDRLPELQARKRTGFEYRPECWLEFDQEGERTSLAGVFQFMEVDPDSPPPLDTYLNQLAEDLAGLDPVYLGLRSAGPLLEALAGASRPHYVGLMTRRGPRVVRFLANLRDRPSLDRFSARCGDPSLAAAVAEHFDRLVVRGSLDYDMGSQRVLPRFGLEVYLQENDPELFTRLVESFPTVSPEVRRKSISAASPFLPPWQADECYLTFSHVKLLSTGPGVHSLKTYLGAGTGQRKEPARRKETAGVVAALAAGRPLAFPLGRLHYDFGTEARRDYFQNALPRGRNAYDPRAMSTFLRQFPSEAQALLWFLSIDGTPAWGIDFGGAFGSEAYQAVADLFARQSAQEIDLVSLPAELTPASMRLLGGQLLSVLRVSDLRGLQGWSLVESVQLAEFRARVCYELSNPGLLPPHRALNFAAVHALQPGRALADALEQGLQLETISVSRSMVCRLDSDCWDVRLRFFDPENSRRARRVYRYTVDVAELLPVTLGELRSWSEGRP